MDKNCIFLTNPAEVASYVALERRGIGFLPVAATKSVETLLRDKAIDCATPEGHFSESMQEEVLDRVLRQIQLIAKILESLQVPPGRQACISLQLLFALSAFESRIAVANSLCCNAHELVEAKPLPLAFPVFSAKLISPMTGGRARAETPFLPLLNGFGTACLLDMRANKARTAPMPGLPRHIRLTAARNCSYTKALAKNTVQGVRAMLQNTQAARAVILPGKPIPSVAIEAALRPAIFALTGNLKQAGALAAYATLLLAVIEADSLAAGLLLDRYGKHLRLVVLDSPANTLEVALAEASRRRCIAVIEESHGAIVVYGGGNRQQAAAILAGGGYNWIPDADWLVPRSPLQTAGAPPKRLLKVNRMVAAYPRSAVTAGFKILFAPNFVRWNIAIPALTATCFDIHAIAGHMVSVLARRPDLEMDMRIKLTTKDAPSAHEMEIDRGLLPRDLERFFSAAKNIRNASALSWPRLLSDCDLVVTEGVTSVMFEALEHRKPVLLMNRSAKRVPSLPAWRLDELQKSTGRNAVYASSCEEDTEALLDAIIQRHHGKPLLDGELRQHCWVDEPKTGKHYLHSALGLLRQPNA